MTDPERHARLLLRCYPRVWREQYGDELSALVLDELAERPRVLRRDWDVICAGLRARMAACGLLRGPVQDRPAIRLVAVSALVVFVAAVLSIWTQLADGWLTTQSGSAAVSIGFVTLSIWLGTLLLVAMAVGGRAAADVVRALRAGRSTGMLPPLSVQVGSAAFLVGGVWLMAPKWPAGGTVHHRGVLAYAARIGWASSDSISTFWLHPHRLLSLPAGELAWMVLCPVAVAAFAGAGVRVARIAGVRARGPMRGSWSRGGIVAMPCLVTASAWVIGSQHAANAAYRAGTLDLVLIAAMATATLVARNALVRPRTVGGRGGS